MHTTRLRNVGGSVMMAMPKAILEGLGLQANQELGLSINDGRIVIEPKLRPSYTLDELMAQCDFSAPMSDEDKDWLNMPAVGTEVI